MGLAFSGQTITGGASNVSFGMPNRPVLNAHFLAVATVLGMNLPITDPTDPNLRFGLLSGTISLGTPSSLPALRPGVTPLEG